VAATPYAGIELDHLTMPPRVRSFSVPRHADAPAFLRRALVEAIDVALRGVRRVAVATGGGLDSSVLLGLAWDWARRTGGSAFAVSLDFEAIGDDRPHLAALERHLGCEVIRVKPEEAAPRIALLTSGIDGVPVPFSTMPMEVELRARALAHGAERVLSGAGGDELFGGSPQALAELAWRGHPLRAVRAARCLEGFGEPTHPAWSWVGRPFLGRMIPGPVREWRARRQPPYESPAWLGPVARAFLEEARQRDDERAGAPRRTAPQRFEANRSDPHRVVLAWARHQEAHASGVDCWDPYLDLDLAAAVTSLPPDYLLFGNTWRGLLRAAAGELLPDSLRERMDKACFEPALQRFMVAAGGLESLRPLASARALASLGLVEPKAFAAAFDAFVAAPEDGLAWVTLWSALSIEAFLRGREPS
jgi:asparagine synthase (glutamine-hydrolysing)